ncbi:hypothetical protein J4H86_15890 [Spiractinospora alimapuensis]|uniref:hypothetical protein n=1 Tax=Spiractinospora alimapuensis TaxID=2820884 RepID=UPI001F24BB0F|nr:hypothetical protein [Spiractinospora alimapuensis]QVQ50409.1 hypothetical protein J4H86_15890 [Spiractinospora alimapuensis]
MRTSFFTRSALVAVGALAVFGLGSASASAQDLNEVLDTVNLGDAVNTNINGPGDDAVSQNAASADPTALLDESTLAGLDPTGTVPMSSVSDLADLGELTGAVDGVPSTTQQSERVGSGVEDLAAAVDTESVVRGLQDVVSPAAQVEPGEISATPQREEQANPLGDVSGTVGPVGDQVNGVVSDLGGQVTDNDLTGDVVSTGEGVADGATETGEGVADTSEVEGAEVTPQSATGGVQSLVEGVAGGLGGSLLG